MTKASETQTNPTDNTGQATAAAPTLQAIHALLWKLYNDLQQLRERREQHMAKHAGELLSDAFVGREFDRTRLVDLPTRDEETLLETAIDELTRRQRPAIVKRFRPMSKRRELREPRSRSSMSL